MGLFDKLRGELVDIVEWIDDTRHTLVWRFPRYHNQIKNGAQLIVRPGQLAVFVDRGRLADVFEPGMHELTTANLPVLGTLKGWKHGFESPFKAEVYFVSTRQVTDLKWGTPNPIMLRDADFGPIRLRAFGTYTLRAQDARALLNELVGTDGIFEAEEINELLRSMIATSFADVLGGSTISALDLAANYSELSEQVRQAVVARIDDEYGLDIPAFFIVNISFPPEVEKALDKRSSMGILGDLNRYQQFQMANAMEAAADNPASSGVTDGMGMGLGFAMAGQMAQGSGVPAGAAQGHVPPPPPQAAWHITEHGQTQGPFSPAQVLDMIASRRLCGTSLLWSPGMAAWTPLEQVPQFSSASAAVPPPPPPV